MRYNRKYENCVLVEREIPCMTEGCNNMAIVYVPKGEPIPRGLRKWCSRCSILMNKRAAGRVSQGEHHQGDRRV